MAEVTKKIINIPKSLKGLFKDYLVFTKPLNKLRAKEIELMAYILYQNELEKPNFKRVEDRWGKILGTDGRVKIMQELDLTDYNLNNLLTSLRKKGAIINNQVPDYYVPQIDPDTKDFQIIVNFHING